MDENKKWHFQIIFFSTNSYFLDIFRSFLWKWKYFKTLSLFMDKKWNFIYSPSSASSSSSSSSIKNY